MSDTSSPLYVTLAAGVEFTLVSSKAGYGYTFVEMGGIRNYVYNRVASTFTWAADTAANWNSVANWTVDGIVAARLPDSDDDVVFPAGTHTVILSTKNGTEKCASINIDSGSLTLQYSGNSWVELYLHGNISGNGTLSLSHVCLNNRTGSDIEVSCPVEIAAVTGDSAFIGDGSWTISGDLEVNGYLKAQSTPVTVSGDAEFASSGVTVETQAAITFTGDTTFNGGFSRNTASGGQTLTFGDVTVTAATTVSGSRPNAFTGTVMLEDGASLTVTTAATTVESATFTAWDPLYKVVSTVVDSTTVYSVERRPGTIFTVY